MCGYLVRRLIGTLPVLLLISLLVFLLLQAAPGDPTTMLLGEEANAADLAEAKRRWGLEQPVPIQYLRFVTAAVSGNLGRSFRFGEPVTEVIAQRLPATIELAILSMLIAITLAIPLGVWAAAKPNSWI